MKINKFQGVAIFIFIVFLANIIFLVAINFDVNGDSSTDIDDLISLATHYRGTYNATYDFNGDSSVDLFDVVALAKNISLESSVSPFDSFDFDSGTLEQKPDAGTFVSWGTQTPSSPYQISDDISRSGTKSLKFPVNGSNNEGNFFLGQDLSEIWIEYYLYHPDGTEGIPGIGEYKHGANGGSENDKFFRLWGESYIDMNGQIGFSTNPLTDTDDANIFGELTLAGASMGPNGGGGYFNFIEDAQRGTWIRIRIYSILDSGAEDGVIKIWRDDTLLTNVSDLDMGNPPYGYWDRGYFFGSDNSGSPNNSSIYMDDLKFYDSDPGW